MGCYSSLPIDPTLRAKAATAISHNLSAFGLQSDEHQAKFCDGFFQAFVKVDVLFQKGLVRVREMCRAFDIPVTAFVLKLFSRVTGSTEKDAKLLWPTFATFILNYGTLSQAEIADLTFELYAKGKARINPDGLVALVKAVTGATYHTSVMPKRMQARLLELALAEPTRTLDKASFRHFAHGTPGIIFPALEMQNLFGKAVGISSKMWKIATELRGKLFSQVSFIDFPATLAQRAQRMHKQPTRSLSALSVHSSRSNHHDPSRATSPTAQGSSTRLSPISVTNLPRPHSPTTSPARSLGSPSRKHSLPSMGSAARLVTATMVARKGSIRSPTRRKVSPA